MIITAFCIYALPLIEQLTIWLQEKAKDYKLGWLLKFAYKAVRAANQKMTPEQWQEKRRKVEKYLQNKINVMGLDLDEDDLDNIIEGLVNQIKEEKQKREEQKQEAAEGNN